MTERKQLGTMDDLIAGLSAEDRMRIEAIKAEMLEEERCQEPASCPEAQDIRAVTARS